jgi:hypothetical protein
MRRSKLFKKASHGASVTLASADTDERWLGDYVEYQRSAACRPKQATAANSNLLGA